MYKHISTKNIVVLTLALGFTVALYFAHKEKRESEKN